jgi:probable rRNA maturation factor
MTQPTLTLQVQRASRTTKQPTTAQLRRWAKAALDQNCEVTLRLVDRREGQELNGAYRNKHYPTNVLTFISQTLDGQLMGDIALCAPVIKDEARAQKKQLSHHYAHMVVHAMLHLQGYDHERERDALKMEALERNILEKLGIPDPY